MFTFHVTWFQCMQTWSANIFNTVLLAKYFAAQLLTNQAVKGHRFYVLEEI